MCAQNPTASQFYLVHEPLLPQKTKKRIIKGGKQIGYAQTNDYSKSLESAPRKVERLQ